MIVCIRCAADALPGYLFCHRCAQLVADSKAAVEQPAPVPNAEPAVWDLVLADMGARDRIGAAKYGVRLQPHNGRDFLRDAYEEALDLAAYLRGQIYERDGR